MQGFDGKALGTQTLWDRIRIAEAKVEELSEKVKKYEQFIKNGVEGGYIQIPDKIDPAFDIIEDLTKTGG